MTDILTLTDVMELLSGSIVAGLILTVIPWLAGMIFVSFKKIVLN